MPPLLEIEGSLLLRTPQQRLPVLFSGRDNPKIAPSRGDIDPSLIHGLLGPRELAAQAASRSVQPFLPTHSQTDSHSTLRAASVAMGDAA